MRLQYITAEIVETNERTLTGEIHTHWYMIEVWDTQTQPDDVEINDQIEIGTDVAGCYFPRGSVGISRRKFRNLTGNIT